MSEIEIKDELDDFYKNLDCDMIELPMRKIDGKTFTIMCDEEGLLKDKPIAACISKKYSDDMIFGNVMFFNNDGMGDLESLTDDDIRRIKLHVNIVMDRNHPAMFHHIIQMD